MTVRVDKNTAHEPNALVYCGRELPNSVVEVPNPVIVVEVLSPSTRSLDVSVKLGGYLSLPSVEHYCSSIRTFVTRIISAGPIRLDPPGIEVSVEEFYPPSA